MPRSLWRALLLACVALMLTVLPTVAQTDEQVLPAATNGSVMVGVQNDVSLAVGEETDAVFIVDGMARIEGSARALVAIDSDVIISGTGASVESVLAIGGTLDLADGATVKDLAYVGTTPTIAPTATVTGEITNIETDLADFAAFLIAALAIVAFFVFIGWMLAVLISALLLVAFGTDQARRAAANIGGDVLKTLVVGLLMLIVPWIVIVLLGITIVGIPLAIGLGLMWGFIAFLGYLVVGLWIGERVLSRSRRAARPYGAAFLGVLILMLVSWIPFVSTIVLWFGLGAVTLAGWRTMRSGGTPPMMAGPGGPYGQTWQVPPPYGQPVYGQPPYAPPPYGQMPPYAPPPQQPPYAPPQQGYWPPEQGGPPAGWPQG
ncbi:MAG TPA: proline-rich domain-containing protein [Candidatus Deferrimicrobium sp.]|nr:proline-rich domain-containing protein [Candidatus Deferrimicrobium sp.]